MRKLTYCDVFYRPISLRREKSRGLSGYLKNHNLGWPMQAASWCNSDLKRSAIRISQILDAAEARGGQRAARGWPLHKGSWCQDRLKGNSLDGFLAEPRKRGKMKIVHYIGIAADEPERVARHLPAKDKILPLVQIGWDEDLCGLIAKYLGMLAPTYTDGYRDGCWFCHNQNIDSLRRLRKVYPHLWEKLMKLDLDSPVPWSPSGLTIHDYDKRFELEEERAVPTDRTFRWDMIKKPPERQLSLFDIGGEFERIHTSQGKSKD